MTTMSIKSILHDLNLDLAIGGLIALLIVFVAGTIIIFDALHHGNLIVAVSAWFAMVLTLIAFGLVVLVTTVRSGK